MESMGGSMRDPPHHDDGDPQEDSETSEMSGTTSEKHRLDSTREELRETSQEALRVAARKSGRRSVIWTMATTWPKSRSYRNS